MKKHGHFIHGKTVEPSSGEWFDSLDPYSGKAWASIARGNAKDVDSAVRSAYEAYTSAEWRSLTPSKRAAKLRAFADAVAARSEELAQVESRDNGKLLTEIRLQCNLLPEWIHYFAGMCDKIEGRIPPLEKPLQLGLIRYEPYGVCAGITPWNSPLLLLVWKLAPALAAGNTFVAKPSEYTSASSLLLAEIASESGLPPGVFNVVTGFGVDVGEPLVNHPLVRRVAFTGGEPGGLQVALAAAKKLIPCTLELGGKSANIIFADADLDAAVNGIVSGIFAASGQTCMAGSRALVHESIYDEVLARLVKIANAAKLGNPREPDTNIAPIATEPQFRKIEEMIQVVADTSPDDDGVVVLRVNALSAGVNGRIHFAEDGPVSAASQVLKDDTFKTKAYLVQFLAVDPNGQCETGDATTWNNKLIIRAEFDSTARKVELFVAPAATLKYTLDGSEPRNGDDYTDPLVLGSGSIKLMVFAEGGGLEAKQKFEYPSSGKGPSGTGKHEVILDRSKPVQLSRIVNLGTRQDAYQVLTLLKERQATVEKAQAVVGTAPHTVQFFLGETPADGAYLESVLNQIGSCLPPDSTISLKIHRFQFKTGQDLIASFGGLTCP